VNKKENRNYIREGRFEYGCLVEGTLKGDGEDGDMKNMDFEFREGIGTGTFTID